MEDFPGRLESRLGPLFAYRKRHGGQTAWLGARFALVDRIDRGGTSLVVRAWDRETDAYIAMKLMAPSVFDSRAREEADVLAKLRHPGVVGIIAAGSGVIAIDADRVECTYVAMELISWPTLADWLRDARPPLRSRLRVLLGLAETLQAVHAHGLVHRDIKPKNVLVSPTGESKLIDFGFAVQTAPKGDARTVDVSAIAGTPGYLPPEAVLQRIGPRSDQYQFGVLGIEALTDGRPGRPTPIGVRQSVEEALGGDVLPIFEKASAFDPESRFRSMDEVVAKLRRVSEPRGISRRTAMLAIVSGTASVGALAWWASRTEGDSGADVRWAPSATAEPDRSGCGRIARSLTLASWVLTADSSGSGDAPLDNSAARYVLTTSGIDVDCEARAQLDRTGRYSQSTGRHEPQNRYPIRSSKTTIRALENRRFSLLDMSVELQAGTRVARRRFCALVDGGSRVLGLVSGAEESEDGALYQIWSGIVLGAPREDFCEQVTAALRSEADARPAGWVPSTIANASLSSPARIVDVTNTTPRALLSGDAIVSTAVSPSEADVLHDADVLESDEHDVSLYRATNGVAIRVGRMIALLRRDSPLAPPTNGWGWIGMLD